MCPTGGSARVLKRYAREVWEISTDHFDPYACQHRGFRKTQRPLAEILVRGSNYSRHNLKLRLYAEGLKTPICELCGQGEIWRGRAMSLILDHENGVRDDHRLENLRIVCPNCAATLDTHCGRNARLQPTRLDCLMCGESFWRKYKGHRYCCRDCALRGPRGRGIPRPERRTVDRPPYERLLLEIAESSWLAVGRRYGVSDNAIRKWVRQYEREAAVVDADEVDDQPAPARGYPSKR